MKHFTKKNITLKKYNINNSFFVKIHLFFKLREIKNNDILICNGYSILGCLDIIKKVNSKKILVIRDTIIHLENEMKTKKRWLKEDGSFVKEVAPYFDKIYSFDKNDCEKYSFEFLDQFIPFTSDEITDLIKNAPEEKREKKSCFFVGEYRRERENILRDIYQHIKDSQYALNAYLYDEKNVSSSYPDFCKNIPISYDENISLVKRSDVIIEINHQEQCGLTLRAIEALAFNKKLITNNKEIIKNDFYSPEKIFIIGHDNYENLIFFLDKENKKSTDNLILKYTSDYMLKKILTDS
ncbi:hypothetical protein [Pectobacterium versatile]|uniref:hypothetical protein n=1 Tax=Pectobacterium versatile TaxID=2488639 RepID=UPI000F64E7FD|nr:hypothetical protein [Pectobacterium versatile]AZK60965.1 hypothetical protein EIP93_00885 [Pectobacterium versatile]UCP81535.1 hypothetical protein LGL95_21525 [Pectobacterium versatile]